MDSFIQQFGMIAVVHLFAVASPGPDFAVILRQSVRYGRQTALWTAWGVGLGIMVHVMYSLLGITWLLAKSAFIFEIVKYVGAAYLIFLGIQGLRSGTGNNPDEVREAEAGKSVPAVSVSASDSATAFPGETERPSVRRAVLTGFLTNGLNPKATLFFLSLFTVILDPGTPLSHQLFFGIYMAVATAGWFSLVASVFSLPRVRRGFRRFGHWFDRITGGLLVALGLRLGASRLLGGSGD